MSSKTPFTLPYRDRKTLSHPKNLRHDNKLSLTPCKCGITYPLKQDFQQDKNFVFLILYHKVMPFFVNLLHLILLWNIFLNSSFPLSTCAKHILWLDDSKWYVPSLIYILSSHLLIHFRVDLYFWNVYFRGFVITFS